MAGHETYHQKYLTLEQKTAWANLVENDLNFQNAARRLKELDYPDDVINEELFTYRMNAFAFNKPELSEFGFIASKEELDTLKEMEVLPPNYERPTRANYLGEDIYELDGKNYYRADNGNWVEKNNGGFFNRLFNKDKEIDDYELIQQLYIEELNVNDKSSLTQNDLTSLGQQAAQT